MFLRVERRTNRIIEKQLLDNYYINSGSTVRGGERNYLFDHPTIFIVDDKLSEIVTPSNYLDDLYYFETNDDIIFSDNYVEIKSSLVDYEICLDDKAVNQFINLGSVEKPNTLYEGIKVLFCDSKYKIEGGGIDSV